MKFRRCRISCSASCRPLMASARNSRATAGRWTPPGHANIQSRSTGMDMMHTQSAIRSEKGDMLVHVALGLLMLTAVSALAVDYGLFWVGRRAAQNSADAAALAGAVALAYDDADDF